MRRTIAVVPLKRGAAIKLTALQLTVGAFCLLVGSLILVTPHQFALSSYAMLHANLAWWGVAFLAAGAALMAAAVYLVVPPVAKAMHLLVAGLLFALAVGFVGTGAFSGTIVYGVLAIGVAMAPFSARVGPETRLPQPPHRNPLALIVCASAVGLGLLLLLPQSIMPFLASGGFQEVNWHGLAFLVGGVALGWVQWARAPSAAAVWTAHLAAAAAYWSWMLVVGLPSGALTAVAYYGLFGIALAMLPWLGPRLASTDFQSLHARLAIALAAAAALPLIAAMSFVTSQEERQVIREVLGRKEALATLLAQDVATYIDLHRSATLALATHPGLMDRSAQEQEELLLSFHEAYPSLFGLGTFDSEGMGVARSDGDAPGDASGDPAFERVRENAEFVLEIRPLEALGPVFIFLAPVTGAGGTFEGMVVTALESTQLTRHLVRSADDAHVTAFLVNEGGRVIAHNDDELLFQFANIADRPPVTAFLESNWASGSLAYGEVGQRQIAGYARVPGHDWGVIVERPRGEALAAMRGGRDIVFGLLVTGLFSAALLGVALARGLTAPLGVLTTAADAVAREERHVPLPTSRLSEVAKLTAVFDRMRQRLQARTDELIALTRSLEREVEERRSAEEALKSSKDQLSVILHSIGDGILVHDASGALVYANEEAARLGGFESASELSSLAMTDLLKRFAISDESGLPLKVSELPASKIIRGEKRASTVLRLEDPEAGGERWLMVRAAPVLDEAGELALVVNALHDITSIKRAELRLSESEERFRSLFSSAPMGLVAVDQSGRVVLANPELERLFGYGPGELEGQLLEQLLPSRFHDRHAAHRSGFAAAPTDRPMGVDLDLWGRRKDGSEFPVEVSLTAIQVGGETLSVAFVVDITQRRAAEEERTKLFRLEQTARIDAEQANMRLAFLAEASHLLAGTLDHEAALANVARLALGRLCDWCAIDIVQEDGSLRRQVLSHQDPNLKWAADELLTLYPPDPNVSRGAYQVLMSNEAEIYRENPDELIDLVAKDDRHRALLRELGFASAVVVPLAIRDEVVGVMTLARKDPSHPYTNAEFELAQDLGRRTAVTVDNARLFKTAQELNETLELRVKERTAELEDVISELEAFSYTVSHDLRAPLRGIDGFSNVLLKSQADKLDDNGKAYLGRIREAAKRMGQLIDQLLDFSRLSRAEIVKEDVNLSRIAAEISAGLQSQYPERSVYVDIPAGLRAAGNPKLLEIVLQNLLSNAFKFTAPREQAVIELGVIEGDAEDTFFVRDNGVGFDMAHRDMLFAVFRRLHGPQEFEGTGIGLATVKRVVERHGGKVWAESEVGQGATFYFTLPKEASYVGDLKA